MKESNPSFNQKKKFIFYTIILACILVLSFIASISYSLMLSDKIYTGVMVDNIDSSRLSKEQLKNILKERYDTNYADKKIILKSDELEKTFTYHDIRGAIDIDSTVKKAFEYGRNGDFFSRFIQVSQTRTNSVEIPLQINFDKEIVSDIISSIAKDILITPIAYELVIEAPYRVTLINGRVGRKLNTKETKSKVFKAINNYFEGIIHLPIIKEIPKPIEENELYERINLPAQNAKTKIVNNEVKIIPESIGREISIEDVRKVLADIKNTDIFSISLPVNFISPDITKKDINKSLFRDSLSHYSTQFYTGDINNNNRKVNIILAISKIDGLILNPGDVFSFNRIVGPRIPERGFKSANSYIGGEIVESTGGGICQVSSTLYNAVLLANLNVLERYNHMFTVGYVPLGKDSAVAYDSDIDLRFKNNTEFPLKISGWVSEDNRAHIELIGTDLNPNTKVELSYDVIRKIDYTVEETYDDTLEKGIVEVIEEGIVGYIVDSFKTVVKQDEPPTKIRLSRNYYNPYAKKINIGIKEIKDEEYDTVEKDAIEEKEDIYLE